MIDNFDYEKPKTIKQAVSALAKNNSARVLAGGTDLIVLMRAGVEHPEILVDIKNIPALREIKITKNCVSIGAAVSLNELSTNKKIAREFNALVNAANSIGTFQLRNRATLAGNICNASPAADAAPSLLIFNAEVCVAGKSGVRQIPISDFFVGVKKTALLPGEFVTNIILPFQEKNAASAFAKQQRLNGHDLAIANAAALFLPKKGILKIALGSVFKTPISLPEISASKKDVKAAIRKAIAAAKKIIAPIDDVRSSAEYRKIIVEALIKKVVTEVLI